MRKREKACGEKEHERRLVALLLPVVAAEDGVEEGDEDGSNGGLRVQHLRVTSRHCSHEPKQLEDVGHVLNDAAVQILGGRGGDSTYVLHGWHQTVLDLDAERLVRAGDADEGDERLEEVVDVVGVGDVLAEKREVLR